jgi:hypothetical protein
MRKAAMILVTIMAFATVAHCQTMISPVQEFGKKVNSDFTLRNDGLHTLQVEIKPLGFKIADGKDVYTPIETTAKLTVKDQQFKLGPMQSHIVAFKGTCLQLPCAVKIFAEITDPSQVGVKTIVRLPCVVYSCDKAAHCRKTMLASWSAK